LNAAAALIGGLAGFAAWTIVAYSCHAVWPRRFTFNPLYFLGAAFTIETTAAYGLGLGVALVVSEAYALLIGALAYAFDAGGTAWLLGAAAGSAMTVMSGSTLAYAGLLHRGVRSGLVGAPGPMAVRHGSAGVSALFGWHAMFGLMTGLVYGTLA